MAMSSYVEWGRHIVLLISASASSSASNQLLRKPLLKFFWEACLLAFDFYYDLSRSSYESVFYWKWDFP